MKPYTLYDAATGLFSAHHLTLPDDMLAANTPTGMALIEGEHDHLAVMVDVATGQVVQRTVAPPDTANYGWAWDEGAKRWGRVPSASLQDMLARRERERSVQALETSQARAIRALMLDPNDQAARARLEEIEAAIVATGIRRTP